MTDKKTSPVENLQQVVKNVDIIDILLINQSMAINIHPNDLQNKELDINHGFRKINYNHNTENNVLSVILTLDLKATEVNEAKKEDNTKQSKQNFLFHMSYTYCVNYITKEDVCFEEEALNIFSRTNAIYNSYPYFRNAIQESCSKLAIPPIVLPFLKPFTATQINNMFAKKEVEESDED